LELVEFELVAVSLTHWYLATAKLVIFVALQTSVKTYLKVLPLIVKLCGLTSKHAQASHQTGVLITYLISTLHSAQVRVPTILLNQEPKIQTEATLTWKLLTLTWLELRQAQTPLEKECQKRTVSLALVGVLVAPTLQVCVDA